MQSSNVMFEVCLSKMYEHLSDKFYTMKELVLCVIEIRLRHAISKKKCDYSKTIQLLRSLDSLIEKKIYLVLFNVLRTVSYLNMIL
jgi:hypothetical protein